MDPDLPPTTVIAIPYDQGSFNLVRILGAVNLLNFLTGRSPGFGEEEKIHSFGIVIEARGVSVVKGFGSATGWNSPLPKDFVLLGTGLFAGDAVTPQI